MTTFPTKLGSFSANLNNDALHGKFIPENKQDEKRGKQA